MNVAVLRHHAEDSFGFVGCRLEARGARLAVYDATATGGLPDPAAVDAAVVLGAAWSVNDRGTVGAWIDAETAWLRAADSRGVPVLGICFGAQLMAACYGGAVERAPRPEIGWSTIRPVPPPGGLPGIGPGPWLEFHEDRCLLPPGAELLASNQAGVQAYRLRRNLAVQFHPEVDGAALAKWLDAGGSKAAIEAGTDPDAFLAETFAEEPEAASRAARLVDGWLDVVAGAQQARGS